MVGQDGSVSEFLVRYLDSIDERLLGGLDEDDELRLDVVKRLRFYASALLEGSITPAAARSLCPAPPVAKWYTSHGNTCAAGWGSSTTTPTVTSGTYATTCVNIGTGTYFATVTQSDAAGNVGTVTTGPLTR